MPTFTGTFRDDDFAATNGADFFRFGENEGVDLIVGFDLREDRIVYTDRSVDGFDDIEAAEISIRGVASTVIESNDQFTVLFGVRPLDLSPSNFVFTTGDNDGDDFEDAFDDLDDLDDDVSLAAIEARLDGLTDAPDGRTQIAPDTFVEPRTIIDGPGDTELAVDFTDGAGRSLGSFLVAEDSELNGSAVVTALGATGRFAIAWEFADDDDPEDAQVLVRVYEFDGGSLSQASGTTRIGGDDDRTDEPAIATLADGSFVVAGENDASGEVVAQVFSPDGAPIGSRLAVGDTNRSGEPTVRATDDGFAVGFVNEDGAETTREFPIDGTSPDEDEDGPDTGERPALADALVGTEGADRLRGTQENELLFGSGGNDRLFGGGGDDLLVGGAGRDRLTGGDGADAFAVTQGSERTIVTDFEAGTDLLLFLSTGADAFGDLTITSNRRGDAVVRFEDERLVLRDTDAADLSEADFSFDLGDWVV